jgi:hypothetical protein
MRVTELAYPLTNVPIPHADAGRPRRGAILVGQSV